MKERLTISEMAKLRGLTTETLRHYDRIGLFRPKYVDPHSGYRYYSIFQYEILGTIKELRQIGMSTEEIKQYFNQRNFKKSRDILKAKHAELVLKLKELAELEVNIQEKLDYLEAVSREEPFQMINLREIKSRKLITLNEKINSNLELCYSIVRLETMLTEKAPILASNRLGIIIEHADIMGKRFEEPSVIFVVAKEDAKIDKQYLKVIPGGLFACIRYNGELLRNRSKSLNKLFEYHDKNGYQMIGDGLQIMQVDITVTDNPNEVMFEIQVPVRKAQAPVLRRMAWSSSTEIKETR
ncbi:MerR family transcriptional regulator [Neobacillus niacini]|uniref:MerR family transcriptional regulator n=1 Tax=Neobacillus niacini TaxID=86668 RepID=UPI002855C237|nr:MerR family transcriptional regulator [Neobacillus niacini]MDR7002642.1 DNA-binding transcriptional MerR regulator [Neobacillus niacini]